MLGSALLLLAPAAGAQSALEPAAPPPSLVRPASGGPLAFEPASPLASPFESLSASVSGGGARAVSSEHAREFGLGGWAAASLGMRAGPGVVLGASATALTLPHGDAPPAGYAKHEGASLFAFGADVRARPWPDATPPGDTSSSLKGLWLGGGVGAALTGGVARFMLAGHIGYDFWLGPRVALGPAASLLYVAQPDQSVRPEDAVVALVGARLVLEPAPPSVPSERSAAQRAPSDRDHDGVEDPRDRCPDAPEDLDGVEDFDGCPEDDDGDGVPDVADACRSLAEDRDGYQDEDGCPEADNDYDGVADPADRCPNDPEDRDGFQDDDGCPEADNDQDGVPDLADRCPSEAETKNGFADNDGCPDDENVRVSGNEILLDVKVSFVPDLAPVRKGSWGVLGRLARLLASHPQYETLTIEAYADGPGNAQQDRELSALRAESVRYRLSQFGVGSARLEAVGRGQPKAPAGGEGRAPAGAKPKDHTELAFRITRRGAPSPSSPSEGAR